MAKAHEKNVTHDENVTARIDLRGRITPRYRETAEDFEHDLKALMAHAGSSAAYHQAGDRKRAHEAWGQATRKLVECSRTMRQTLNRLAKAEDERDAEREARAADHGTDQEIEEAVEQLRKMTKNGL